MNKPFKTVTLEEILTPSEIERARELYREKAEESFNTRLVRELIAPNIERINKVTLQENDPRFIGYAIEWCLLQERKAGIKTERRDTRFKRKTGARRYARQS